MTKEEIFAKLQTEVTIRELSPGTYYTYERAIDLFLQLFLLFPCLFNLCQPFQLLRCVLQPKVGVGVQGDRNVRMAHQILQRLRIHLVIGRRQM